MRLSCLNCLQYANFGVYLNHQTTKSQKAFKMQKVIDQVKSNVSSKSIEQIEDMLQEMAKTKRADMDDAAKVVRVALLDIVEEKRGEEYVDQFMDFLDEIEAAH